MRGGGVILIRSNLYFGLLNNVCPSKIISLLHIKLLKDSFLNINIDITISALLTGSLIKMYDYKIAGTFSKC